MENGNEIIESKGYLGHNLLAGNDLRFYLNKRSLYSSIQSATLVGDENSASNLFSVSKSLGTLFSKATGCL